MAWEDHWATELSSFANASVASDEASALSASSNLHIYLNRSLPPASIWQTDRQTVVRRSSGSQRATNGSLSRSRDPKYPKHASAAAAAVEEEANNALVPAEAQLKLTSKPTKQTAMTVSFRR